MGGNGSGKSTLLKLLTGLYYPDVGTLGVDDKVIEQNNYQAYRELFSIIFTDFHLFDRLYGLPTFDEPQLNALLRLMANLLIWIYPPGKKNDWLLLPLCYRINRFIYSMNWLLINILNLENISMKRCFLI